MKKITNRFMGKSFLAMAIVGSGFFIAGCNNSDYNKEGATTTVAEIDTAMARNDTSMNKTNMAVTADTSTSVVTTDEKVHEAKPTGTKTHKKGRVNIVPAEVAASKNTTMEKDKEGYYKNTEVLPSFPGGQKALERFFEKNIQYPETATENDAQGIVKLSFLVDENGKIYQPLPVGNKIGYGIEEEAVRVFNKMPTWVPGKIKGKNVKTRFTLPINFQLY